MNNKVFKVLPIVLSIVGSIGVIGTSILVAKETPDVNKKLEENKDAKKLDKLKIVIKGYAPAIAVGTATIASITTSTIISKKVEASLSATCMMLNRGYNKYKDKVKEVFGIDGKNKISKLLAEDELEEKNIPTEIPDNKQMYFNEFIGWFSADPFKVERALSNMNMRINSANSLDLYPKEEERYCTLKQFVDESEAEIYDKEVYEDYKEFGWSLAYLSDCWEDSWLFSSQRHEKTEDGINYIMLEFMTCGPIKNPETGYYFDTYEPEKGESNDD